MGLMVRAHSQICQRWAGSHEPQAKRIVAAILALPILMVLASLVAGAGFTAPVALLALAGTIGMTLILCAMSALHMSESRLIGLLMASQIAGFTALAVLSQGSIALALMVVALPLETWFVSRDLRLTGFAAIAAGSVNAVLGLTAQGQLHGGSAFAVMLLGLYAASLIMRGLLLHKRQIETRLVSSEPLLPNTTPDGLQLVLNAQGGIHRIDAESASRFGLTPDLLQGRTLLDHVLVADRVQYLSLLADLRADLPTRPIDIRLRGLENGISRFQSYRVSGSHIGNLIVLCGRSMAREDQLLCDIATLQAELETERLSKNKLLAAVSHELRTPLNSIIGFSDLLSHEIRHNFDAQQQSEYARIIHKSGSYMLELVNAVLDNARLETGSYTISPQSFDFGEIVEHCTQIMLGQAEQKNIAFCHRVKADIGSLKADKRAVQQIILNLSANAVKFTPEGGCVTIDARQVIIGKQRLLEFSLSDTGIGIAPADLERVCQPFTRADNDYTRSQEGSGLGLSVVKGLVELHQGNLVVKSNVGEGTTVTVQLPVAGPYFDAGDQLKSELGTVIDIHLSQEEQSDEWKKDESRNQDFKQIRKTG